MKHYGTKITARVHQVIPIEELLKKHRACELLEMLTTLHPNWQDLLPLSAKQKAVPRSVPLVVIPLFSFGQ